MEQPAARIERVEYYYTVVPNRVGAGAKVFNELKAQNVSLIAFNGFPLSAQRSQLDLVPSSGVALFEAAEKAGIKLSGLSSHTALCRPDISGNYLKQAIRFAAECGAPVVNTDEGPKPPWTTEAEDHVLMRYVLTEAAAVAEPRGIMIGLEPHQQYSKTPDGLDKICKLVDSPAIGVNFDTGNSYLSGEDPVGWLERVKDKLVHVHAKDISIQQSEDERGKVTGTPAGCACGDGVIDWKSVIEACKDASRDLVLSVECGTVEQAERSIEHLKKFI